MHDRKAPSDWPDSLTHEFAGENKDGTLAACVPNCTLYLVFWCGPNVIQ